MKQLDLRKDFAEVSAFVAERAKAFDPAANPGPGKGKRISRIDVGFGVDYGGWVCLVFDTRRNPDPDGEQLSVEDFPTFLLWRLTRFDQTKCYGESSTMRSKRRERR